MSLLDPARLHALLGTTACRLEVIALAECASSNDELLILAGRQAASGTVLVADRQHAGRGRRGRTWCSSPEDSLTFSLLWRFPAGAALSGLSLAIGVAVARALHDLGVSGISLKWPNDVLLDAGKLGGILVELSSDRRGSAAIIGIGLNLRHPATAPQDIASAALTDTLPGCERHALLAALLARLVQVLDTFTATGFSALRSEWCSHDAWQGQPVKLLGEQGAVTATGICRGADDDGALLLETTAGITRHLSGDLSLRPDTGDPA